MEQTKTKHKRDRRKLRIPSCYSGLNGIRGVRPQNKFVQMCAVVERCRDAIIFDPENSLLSMKDGWTFEKYKFLMDYCGDKLEKHRYGRECRLLGGREQTEKFNKLFYELVQETE